MLRVQNNGTSDITIGHTAITANGGFKLFPADRCTWDFTYTNGQYNIANAEFYPGSPVTNNAPGTANDFGLDLNGTNRIVSLGYIGKSGRFIEIAE